MAGTKRRSTRQAASRKRSVYIDPDTDDEFEAQSEDEIAAPEPLASPVPTKRRKSGPKRKPATRSRTKGKNLNAIVGRPRKPNSQTHRSVEKVFSGASDYRIPDWTLLPTNILRDVFVFASQPIHGLTPEAFHNANWLLKASRICRAFALPALEAFYRSPPITSRLQPHLLLDRLKTLKDQNYIDYTVKIKDLTIDVQCLAGVAHNRPPFDICDLIMQLPQLKSMEILHPKHTPPYRSVRKIQGWTVSMPNLIAAMDANNIRLKSWRWSRDNIPKMFPEDLYRMLALQHDSKVFAHLDRLIVSGFNVDDSAEPMGSDDEASELPEPIRSFQGLAYSITRLPNIKDLSFISCDIIMNKFLLRLPNNLQRLELTNCLEITSDMIRTYLASSGSQIRQLTLNHNPALNFSFFTGLKSSCTKLEKLEMDLQYYSERDNVNDADPLYDELLMADEVPAWPSTLQYLSLTHAPKMTAQAAENLFRSLLDAAPDLPMLRRLIIHAHINIPWRDRVGFREQWIGRLKRVYLRRSKDPLPYMGSFRQYRLWKQSQGLEDVLEGSIASSVTNQFDSRRPGLRELTHVLVSPRKPTEDVDMGDATNSAQPRRSKRVADNLRTKSVTPEAESTSATSDEEDWDQNPESFVQGLCDVVDIRIDNQRPCENQFTEGDFLDSEGSGDEDWREDAEENDDDGYAW